MASSADNARILMVETSCAQGSVGIAVGGEIQGIRPIATNSKHCQLLLPTIRELCADRAWTPDMLDEIYVSSGPGSFTGLRIAITVVKTLAIALGARVVAVPTLRIIAARVLHMNCPPESLAVALDAKRKQVYGASFRLGPEGYEPALEPCLIAPEELLRRCPRPLCVTGEGLAYHGRAFRDADVEWVPEEFRWPRAEEVHRVGWQLARTGQYTQPERLLPFYLRIPEAEERWAERQLRRAGQDDIGGSHSHESGGMSPGRA